MRRRIKQYAGAGMLALPFVAIFGFVWYLDPKAALFVFVSTGGLLVWVAVGVFLLAKEE